MHTQTAEINNPWLAERAREIQQSILDIERDVVPLQYLQLGWRPPTGGWTIAQVMEHLIISDRSYVDLLTGKLQQPPARPVYSTWRPSLMGGLLVRAQRPESKRKVTTPPMWRPGPEARAEVVQEYIELRKRLLALVRQADGHDLRRTRLSSPAAKWLRLNLGDAIMTLVVHTQRHLQQIERIKSTEGFPDK